MASFFKGTLLELVSGFANILLKNGFNTWEQLVKSHLLWEKPTENAYNHLLLKLKQYLAENILKKDAYSAFLLQFSPANPTRSRRFHDWNRRQNQKLFHNDIQKFYVKNALYKITSIQSVSGNSNVKKPFTSELTYDEFFTVLLVRLLGTSSNVLCGNVKTLTGHCVFVNGFLYHHLRLLSASKNKISNSRPDSDFTLAFIWDFSTSFSPVSLKTKGVSGNKFVLFSVVARVFDADAVKKFKEFVIVYRENFHKILNFYGFCFCIF